MIAANTSFYINQPSANVYKCTPHLSYLYHITHFHNKENFSFGELLRHKAKTDTDSQVCGCCRIVLFPAKCELFLFRFGQFLDQHFSDTELAGLGAAVLFDV